MEAAPAADISIWITCRVAARYARIVSGPGPSASPSSSEENLRDLLTDSGTDADLHIWLFIELDAEGWPNRQVNLDGLDGLPSTAAALDEVMYARDHGGIAAVQAYDRKYGVVAEGNSADWDWDFEEASIADISADEFERVWTAARYVLEHRQRRDG
ncbi:MULTISPECIES: hypothetical protein [Nocardia]|uniref:hypothetical protein n=1 Tax=Nocardia TaxID=1817 RepID=UPI000D686EBB|nr:MULTISPECIES: hypothetical protein [Nocardia]